MPLILKTTSKKFEWSRRIRWVSSREKWKWNETKVNLWPLKNHYRGASITTNLPRVTRRHLPNGSPSRRSCRKGNLLASDPGPLPRYPSAIRIEPRECSTPRSGYENSKEKLLIECSGSNKWTWVFHIYKVFISPLAQYRKSTRRGKPLRTTKTRPRTRYYFTSLWWGNTVR